MSYDTPDGVYDARNNQLAPAPYRSQVTRSWLLDALGVMAKHGIVAMSLTPGVRIQVTNAGCRLHGYGGPDRLVNACMTAVQGAYRKIYAAYAGGANTTPVAAAMDAARWGVGEDATTAVEGDFVFGWLCRIAASQLNFRLQTFTVKVGPVTIAGAQQVMAAPQIELAVTPSRIPIDLIVLSVANAGGIGSVIPGRHGDVYTAAAGSAGRNVIMSDSAADANQFVSFESLNQRDLMAALANVAPNGQIDPLGHEFNAFPGIS